MRYLSVLAFMAVAALVGTASAQQRTGSGTTNITIVGQGSTVEGDIRRGEGVFLQGLGWYELNNAKAVDQYWKTVRENDAYYQQQNAAARKAYNQQTEADKRFRNLKEADRQRALAEREYKLRTSPTSDDIEKGDALNALLVDLSNPNLSSLWRGFKVDLPKDISIKGLAFQFTPKANAKASAALSQGLIALGRLDTAGRWPDVIRDDKLKAERVAYEAAYSKIVEQSKAGQLELSAVLAMDDSLKSLATKVKAVVPKDRGFQGEATKYVEELMAATKMFNASTLGYAREMIADTSQHEAQSVGELLAFMRKYRLVFAKADSAPGGSEKYTQLYGLLRQQADALGLKPKMEQVLAGPSVPANSKAFDGKRYKVFDEELSWHQAKAKSEEMGGRLASIKNERQNNFVNSLISDAGLDAAWLGATDEAREGNWVWTDGSRMTYSNWNKSDKQPNNKGTGEHALMVIISRGQQWCDQPDRAEPRWHPGFVCQWDVVASPGPSAEPKNAINNGIIEIEGEWLIVSSEKDSIDQGLSARDDWVMRVGNSRLITLKGNVLKWAADVRSVTKTAVGGEISMFGTDGSSKGNPMLAIYERTGDTLRICIDPLGNSQPLSLRTSPGSGYILNVYKLNK